MLIVNSLNEIIYGEQKFINLHSFTPLEIIPLLDLNTISSKEEKTLFYNNKNMIVEAELLNEKNGIKQWILFVNIVCNKIISIEFEISNSLVMKNVFSKKQNYPDKIITSVFNNKFLVDFNHDLYKKIISLKNNNNLIDGFIEELFITVYNNDFLCLIYYNKSLDTFKIICKNIEYYLKDKTTQIYQKNLTLNKNFMAHIFHEIKNYLNIINISTINLESSIINNCECNNFNDINDNILSIKDSSLTLTDIISDVLTLEKINTNNIKIRKTNFMLNDLFNRCVYTMQHEINIKQKKFIYENKLNNINIFADYIKIKQCIINLFTNAIKFTNDDGEIYFEIDKFEKDNISYIKFIVRDNGIGIDTSKIQDMLFKDYEQINPEITQNGGGSGLGLSIINHIIKLHDGFVGYISELDKGSEFYFYISNNSTKENNIHLTDNSITQTYNLIPTKPTQIKPTTGSIRKSFTNISTNTNLNLNHKILIVDDNQVIQKLLTKTLNDFGLFNIVNAYDGLEGSTIYLEHFNLNPLDRFTIVLMDQEMPVMNGNDATKIIMEKDINANVIGITGNILIEDKNKFIESGIRELYEKPITKEKLLNILQNLSYIKN
jgi:signal transduction histidine kinase